MNETIDREKKITEIKQALEKATPRWHYNGNEIVSLDNPRVGIGGFLRDENNYLAANAPEWLRWCVDEIEQLRKEIIDQRNLFHEKAYKLAKISEDAYIRELREENERLRKALEFYTDSKKYLVSEKYSGGEFIGSWAEICGDSGNVARRALKEGKHDRTTNA